MEKDKEKKPDRLAGRLLLAMPQMGDPRFHKAVIFICAHDEKGAMGLVVNHILPGLELGELLKQMKVDPAAISRKSASSPVMSGGPVEAARGFILHSSDFFQPDTVKISGDISVTGTVEALKAIATDTGPEKMLFMLGYAGWGAGQLDQEMQQNAWLVADADPGLVFGSGTEEKWDRAVRQLGIDPVMLSVDAGRA
jgi:putative transcriptional regulator